MKKRSFALIAVFLSFGCEKEWTAQDSMNETSARYRHSAEYDLKYAQPESYHGWAEPVYAYKSYAGEPSIDSEAFYANLQGCSVWYTQYDNLSDRSTLKKLAAYGDSGAMLRLAMLADYDSDEYWAYVDSASSLHNLNARVLFWKRHKLVLGSDGKTGEHIIRGPFYAHLEVYAKVSPFALYAAIKDIKKEGASDVGLIPYYKRLRGAGNDPYLLGYSAAGMYRAGVAEEIDRDNLCEAYFRGCDWLYDIKKDILCADLK